MITRLQFENGISQNPDNFETWDLQYSCSEGGEQSDGTSFNSEFDRKF